MICGTDYMIRDTDRSIRDTDLLIHTEASPKTYGSESLYSYMCRPMLQCGSGEKPSINECVVKEKMYLCSLID